MRNAGLEEAQAGIKISGEISITSDMQTACYLRVSTKETKNLNQIMRLKEYAK